MVPPLSKFLQAIEYLLNEGSYGRLLLIAVAMAVAIAAPLQEPSLQEALAYINTLHSQEVTNGKLRDLYEALRRGGDDIEDEALLQAKIIEYLQTNNLLNKADKRASYMSLCHFKICNMGRKRTLWPRN
ncbi:uncharacterized protein CNMa [Halyomorpha halys]|uniref:uncharacterized protein CNMa n=1 Tax=Halyomorpha halys TaxID=286706 RepID=UPI0034D228E3